MYRALMNRKLYNSVLDGLDTEKAITYDAYVSLLDKLSLDLHVWPKPRRIEICKTFSQKRRIVYAYPVEEMFILRAVNHYLCRKYKNALALSYFPSRQRTPSQCLSYILNKKELFEKEHPEVKGIYGMHLDVSDYFNSMNTEILFNRLPQDLRNDEDFGRLYRNTVLNPWCESGGKLIRVDQKGAMAGLPFTAFFAAIYLAEMDRDFEKAGIPYARYSDDILFFTGGEESLKYWSDEVRRNINDAKLKINEDKTEYILPEDAWTFIGFEIENKKIDISLQQYEKLKRRFAKWARRYRRSVALGYGRDMRKMPPEKAVTLLIKNINRALFKPIRDKYCWAQWAFPTISTTKRLKSLDEFIQEKLRFVYTGCYSRKNFRLLPYEKLKEMGYHSLEQLYLLHRYRPEDFEGFFEKFILSRGPELV